MNKQRRAASRTWMATLQKKKDGDVRKVMVSAPDSVDAYAKAKAECAKGEVIIYLTERRYEI